jgi:hypothetical protein
VALRDDLDRVAGEARAFLGPGEELAGVVPAETEPGRRTYLCSFERGGAMTWLVLDDAGQPVTDRESVRQTVSIAAMCDLAEESAGGGDLAELRERLVAVRLTESPPGIEEAEAAALALERAIGAPPRLAEPAYLDRVGAAARELERALGEPAGSPFAEAMKRGLASVDELIADLEANYRLPFD